MIQPDDLHRFCPLLPRWMVEYCELRAVIYPDTYQALLSRQSPSGVVPVSFVNISVAAVNAYADTATTSPGHLVPPYPCVNTDTGKGIAPRQWRIVDPLPPTYSEPVWQAMWTGVVIWQMYYVALGQGGLRMTLGHFGRHRGEKHKYG